VIVWVPGAASTGIVMGTLILPATGGDADPRFEHEPLPQQMPTLTTGRNALPPTVADEPARPEPGETEIDAATARGAVVT
jgi:hypothetical protein